MSTSYLKVPLPQTYFSEEGIVCSVCCSLSNDFHLVNIPVGVLGSSNMSQSWREGERGDGERGGRERRGGREGRERGEGERGGREGRERGGKANGQS